MVVGLNMVDQLTLCAHFSDISLITEVYNLRTAGNPNNHLFIPGNEQAGVSNPWTGGLLCQQY